MCGLLVALVAACGTAPEEVALAPERQLPRPAVDVAEPRLQGLWKLEAPGEPKGALLELEGGDWSLFRSCAVLDGTWAARDGLFLGDTTRFKGERNTSCPAEERLAPAWLDTVVGYARDKRTWALLDAEGNLVASLRGPASPPPTFPQTRAYAEMEGDPYPSRDDRAHMNLQTIAPLPRGVHAPDEADLLGRWEPQVQRAEGCNQPFIEFTSGGRWNGHDSGSRADGRWVLGGAGLAIGTASPEDSAACPRIGTLPEPNRDGSYVDLWMLRLARIGLDGADLVFYDPDGIELQRLQRGSAPASDDDIDRDGLADSSEDGKVVYPEGYIEGPRT